MLRATTTKFQTLELSAGGTNFHFPTKEKLNGLETFTTNKQVMYVSTYSDRDGDSITDSSGK